MDDAAENTMAILFFALLAFGLFCLAKMAFADGKSDFCYISNRGDRVGLNQHIPWRPDRTIGEYPNIGAAVEIANKLNCPIK